MEENGLTCVGPGITKRRTKYDRFIHLMGLRFNPMVNKNSGSSNLRHDVKLWPWWTRIDLPFSIRLHQRSKAWVMILYQWPRTYGTSRLVNFHVVLLSTQIYLLSFEDMVWYFIWRSVWHCELFFLFTKISWSNFCHNQSIYIPSILISCAALLLFNFLKISSLTSFLCFVMYL